MFSNQGHFQVSSVSRILNEGSILKPSAIEIAYQQQIDALTPAERVARSAAMFQWTREQIARQLVRQHGEVSPERLKWLVALRLYGKEPAVKMMILGKLADVPS